MGETERSVLIYDGECAYCRRFAWAARRLDRRGRVRPLAYDDAEARALLNAQFGDRPGFTMYLFRGERVYWAQAAARELVRVLGLPGPVSWLAFRLYPALVKLVTRLTRRERAVCMPGQGACSAALAGAGSAPLSDGARRRLVRAADPGQAGA